MPFSRRPPGRRPQRRRTTSQLLETASIRSATTVSRPTPQLIASLSLSLAVIVSLPAPPSKPSVPARRQAGRCRLRRVVGPVPEPPRRRSVPAPPIRRSFPARPERRSAPPRPSGCPSRRSRPGLRATRPDPDHTGCIDARGRRSRGRPGPNEHSRTPAQVPTTKVEVARYPCPPALCRGAVKNSAPARGVSSDRLELLERLSAARRSSAASGTGWGRKCCRAASRSSRSRDSETPAGAARASSLGLARGGGREAGGTELLAAGRT